MLMQLWRPEFEWVSVSSGTGLPGLSRTKAVKRLCVCVPLLSTLSFQSLSLLINTSSV